MLGGDDVNGNELHLDIAPLGSEDDADARGIGKAGPVLDLHEFTCKRIR